MDETISKISNHQWYAMIPNWIVMPNHVHMIVIIDGRGCKTNTCQNDRNIPAAIRGGNDGLIDNTPCRDVPWNVSTKCLDYASPAVDTTPAVETTPIIDASPNDNASPTVETSPAVDASPNDNTSNNDRRTPELMSSISPKTGSLSLVIRQFKQSVTIYAKRNHIAFAWQPRFYESVITKQYEFDRVWRYIDNNVAKWISYNNHSL